MKLLALFLGLSIVTCNVSAQTLTIAPDGSASNPLLSDPYFAASAARYVEEQILNLEDGDVVRIRIFGDRGVAKNMIDQRFVISSRLRVEQLSAAIKAYIADLPTHKNKAQGSTNIISFLEFESGFGCDDEGHVLLLTDGLEASEYIDPNAFLRGTQNLPKPDVSLTGCTVTFYGLGAGLASKSAKFMRHEWQNYVALAGGSFIAIIK